MEASILSYSKFAQLQIWYCLEDITVWSIGLESTCFAFLSKEMRQINLAYNKKLSGTYFLITINS